VVRYDVQVTDSPGLTQCGDDVCITCSDQGVVAEIVQAPVADWEDALVRTEAGTEAVDVSLVGRVAPGDLVLIHAGTAIGRVASK
jgi:hydrogenase maturation factor